MPNSKSNKNAFLLIGAAAAAWLNSDEGKRFVKTVNKLFAEFMARKATDFFHTNWIEKGMNFPTAIRRFREDPKNRNNWIVRMMNSHDIRARMKTERARDKWEKREEEARKKREKQTEEEPTPSPSPSVLKIAAIPAAMALFPPLGLLIGGHEIWRLSRQE